MYAAPRRDRMHPRLLLQRMLYIQVPFTTWTFPTVGADSSMKVTWFAGWTTPPGTQAVPRRRVVGGSRVPMLMRLRSSAAESHAVWFMNCGIVADDEGLPEWQPVGGPRYRASIQYWAEGTDYRMPMTLAELQGESAPFISFAYTPTPACP